MDPTQCLLVSIAVGMAVLSAALLGMGIYREVRTRRSSHPGPAFGGERTRRLLYYGANLILNPLLVAFTLGVPFFDEALAALPPDLGLAVAWGSIAVRLGWVFLSLALHPAAPWFRDLLSTGRSGFDTTTIGLWSIHTTSSCARSYSSSLNLRNSSRFTRWPSSRRFIS